MGMFQFTEEDIARDKLVKPPSFYLVECVKVENRPAATDGSNNTWITWKGLSGEANMVEVSDCLNEKWAPNAKSLIHALTGEPPVAGVAYKIDEGIVGKRLEAFIAPDNVKGVIKNTIKSYRAVTAVPAETPATT